MTNILFISPTGTIDNGAEISIFNLMKYLVNQGHRVSLVAPQYNHPDQVVYFELCQHYDIHAHFIPSIKWWWEDAPGIVDATKEQLTESYRNNIHEVRTLIQKKDIELVITNTVNMFQGAVAAACEGIPHYWLIHEFPENEFEYYKSKLIFIDKNSEAIYGVSGELKKTLQELFSSRDVKSFIPYTEIDTATLKPGAACRIVSVGRITEGKNQLELIKSFSKVKIPGIELVFIGGWESKYKQQCDDWISTNSISNISFTGNLENPWSLVTNKDICVLPSSMETFGLVYVEAILKGVPVIAANNPGYTSVHEIFHFGELYTLGNVDQLTSLITASLRDFKREKEKSLDFISRAKAIYNIKDAYRELLVDIEKPIIFKEKGISAVSNMLTLNSRQFGIKDVKSKFYKGCLKIASKFSYKKRKPK